MTLKTEFLKIRQAARLFEMLRNAPIIEGAKEFYSRQFEIFTRAANSEHVYVWKMSDQIPDVVLMSPEDAKPILDILKIPLRETHMQYPAEDFDAVRAGQCALKIYKKGGRGVIFMNAAQVLACLDPAAQQERELAAVIDHADEIMRQKGLTPNQMIDLLDRAASLG